MATRTMSPGGALLRSSKVFAIPSPLPRPTGPLSSSATFNSDTATLPYPIHQSITTPQSSLRQGDWGFKRPLPLRATTQTSTPIIRVESIDTFEHITEFSSAADHSLTLQKWQEMGMPLSTPEIKDPRASGMYYKKGSGMSVFEQDIDTTTRVDNAQFGQQDKRWKFRGPWLAGLSEGDFQKYLTRRVGTNKVRFREFLRESCASTLTRELAEVPKEDQAFDEGVKIHAKDITEEQISLYLKHLRLNEAVLNRLIREFLDLPPALAHTPLDDKTIGTIGSFASGSAPAPEQDAGPVSTSPYAVSGPPKTHPSAGLSYGRTSSWIFNHHLWGPQRSQPPIEARIVLPKQASMGNKPPMLGVGGIVTDVPQGADAGAFNARLINGKKQQEDVHPGLINVELEKVGGSKVWVKPEHASINTRGNIVLRVGVPDAEARAVRERTEDEIPELLNMRSSAAAGYRQPTTTKLGSGSSYGLSGDVQTDAQEKKA